MKKKAFTLVELLVVIAIIAMLLAILMPALSRVRQLAYQMICGTNQSGIGKAIVVYSSENEEKYPEFGPGSGKFTSWSPTMQDPYEWGDLDTLTEVPPDDAFTTVTSSLFLLVKYADVNPSQFICNAHGAIKFEVSDYADAVPPPNPANIDLTECWDFGTAPAKHVSFAYNYPYGQYSPDGSSPPAVPLLADISPWMKANAAGQTDDLFVAPNSDEDEAPQLVEYFNEDEKSHFELGNSPTHNLDGQNILFNDMHVKFMKTPNVGVEQDNIYTLWDDTLEDDEMRQQGKRIDDFISNEGGVCEKCPTDEDDALLVQW